MSETSTVKEVSVDYATIVTMRTINGQSVQEVADKFGITWEEAREAIRAYGLVVKKDEKAPDAPAKSYDILYANPEKLVAVKPLKVKMKSLEEEKY